MGVDAKELETVCTYMGYVQLSMYEIPAIVINGDTLSGDVNFVLHTPQYVLGNWEEKIKKVEK